MGVIRELAPALIRQLLHSYWLRATAETVVPHHAIRATRTALPYKELFTRGRRRALPFHSWRGVVLKEIIEQLQFLHLFYLLIKSVDVFWPKVFIYAEAWFLIIDLDLVSVKLSRTRPRRVKTTSWKPIQHTLIPIHKYLFGQKHHNFFGQKVK